MSKGEVNNDGPIKTITLNRPEKRNALDQEMLDSLYEIFSEKVSVEARAIVLRANGPSFCAGIDLAERQRQPSTGAVSPVEKVFHAMEVNPLPIVSIVQGAAIAGGCEMALHSEFVVAAETAKFGMSLAQIGLAPSWFLTKKLLEVAGPVNTREILLLGDPMPSSWMLDKGIISRVAPDAQLEQEAGQVSRLINMTLIVFQTRPDMMRCIILDLSLAMALACSCWSLMRTNWVKRFILLTDPALRSSQAITLV